MRNKLAGLLAFFFIINQHAVANEITEKYLTNGQLIGEARFSVLLWKIYDVKLYGSNGEWPSELPYALVFHYLRDITGKDLAFRSITEMRKQGQLNDDVLVEWDMEMQAIFPDVTKGSVLTAVFVPGHHTIFFANSEEMGTIKGDEFLDAFAGIWLGESTSLPDLRLKLIGSS